MPPKKKMKSLGNEEQLQGQKEEIVKYKKQIKALNSLAAKEKKVHAKEIKTHQNQKLELEKALKDKTEEMQQHEESNADKAEEIKVLNLEARNRHLEIDELRVKLEQSNQQKKIVDNLIDKLECPVCLSIPRAGPPPVCPNGHVVCKDCSRNLKTCPVCRVNLGVGQSLLAKTIIELIDHRCKFDGCDEQLRLDKFKPHEQVCGHRTVLCPSTRCTVKVGLSKLLDHVQVNHKSKPRKIKRSSDVKMVNFTNTNPNTSNKDSDWDPITFSYDGKVSFCILVSKVNEQVYVGSVMFASVSECSKYKLEITVHECRASVENSKHSFRFCGQPVSIDEDKKEFDNIGLAINKKGMAKIYGNSDDKNFSCSISIKDLL